MDLLGKKQAISFAGAARSGGACHCVIATQLCVQSNCILALQRFPHYLGVWDGAIGVEDLKQGRKVDVREVIQGLKVKNLDLMRVKE